MKKLIALLGLGVMVSFEAVGMDAKGSSFLVRRYPVVTSVKVVASHVEEYGLMVSQPTAVPDGVDRGSQLSNVPDGVDLELAASPAPSTRRRRRRSMSFCGDDDLAKQEKMLAAETFSSDPVVPFIDSTEIGKTVKISPDVKEHDGPTRYEKSIVTFCVNGHGTWKTPCTTTTTAADVIEAFNDDNPAMFQANALMACGMELDRKAKIVDFKKERLHIHTVGGVVFQVAENS